MKSTCTYRGCERESYAHTLCHTHYCQKRRGVELTPIKPRRPSRKSRERDEAGRKHCPKCDLWLDESDFLSGPAYVGTADGLSNKCRACRSAYMRSWKYGLDQAQLERMVHDQGGTCALCPASLSDGYCVDHDHKCCGPADRQTCGKCVRALLCGDCNRAVGMIETDLARARRWLAYAEESR